MKKTLSQTNQKKILSESSDTKEIPIAYYIIGLFLLWIIFHYKIIFGIAHMWEDMVNFEFPNRIFARDCLINFQFPHWDPNTFSGMPFFASSHTAVLYPTNLLLTIFGTNNNVFWYFMQITILAHLLFSGICMFFYALHTKLSRQAAFLASIGYMFCGFLVTHSIHPMMLYIFAWLPIIIMFIEKGFINSNKAHIYSLIAGLILGISTLAGHPQITFFEMIFLGAYSIYLIFTVPGNKLKQIINLFACFCVAIGIACLLYFPAAELSANSVRTDWTFAQVSEGSFQFSQLITFIIPKVFGAWTGDNNTIPPFWLKGPSFGYYTYWETCFYAGIGILLLAILQFKMIKKDKFILFCFIWMLISMSIAVGNNFFIFKLFYDYVPGFDKFRIPSRILFTWNFLLPFMAARTLDSLRDIDTTKKLSRFFGITAIITLIIALSAGSGLFKNFFPEAMQNTKFASFTASQGWISFFIICAFSIIVYLRLLSKISFKATFILLIGCIIIDLFIFGMNHHQTNTNIIQSVYGRNPGLTAALKEDLSKSLFRVNSRQFAFNNDTSSTMTQNPMRIVERNQGMIDKIQLTEGYNPYNLYRRLPPTRGIKHFQRMLDLLNVKYYIDPYSIELSPSSIKLNSELLPRAKMFYDYKIFQSDSAVKSFMLDNSFDYKRTLLLTNEPKITLPQTTDSIQNNIEITKYRNNKIELNVNTSENGLLWLSEIWYPAWKAYIDGSLTPVHCADYSFRAIEIPKGTHNIKFTYSSKAFLLGAIISIIAFLFALAGIIFTCNSQMFTKKK